MSILESDSILCSKIHAIPQGEHRDAEDSKPKVAPMD
nr:MAG TPA: hypothetical protein [Caudoviricetes sp.]